ncbi:ribbon-helix-helix protein, CopG family [Caulobacter sp. CCNWLY153]|uniref:ribbon-helix-helix protein, CopG family n=1 Tax=unclassified Caulobacter TaxID=2648921 RepID=UPI002FF194D8
MKVETKVYLPADLSKALDQLAIRTRRPKSEIVRAAVASFMSPDGSERSEAALLRRLDRMNSRIERLEKEAQVGNEAMAIFIRTWLGTAPIVQAADEPATRALGQTRYAKFIEALSRRVASGTSLTDQAFEPSGSPPIDETAS